MFRQLCPLRRLPLNFNRSIAYDTFLRFTLRAISTGRDSLLYPHLGGQSPLFNRERNGLSATFLHVHKYPDDKGGGGTQDEEEYEGVPRIAGAIDDGSTNIGSDERRGPVGYTKQAEKH